MLTSTRWYNGFAVEFLNSPMLLVVYTFDNKLKDWPNKLWLWNQSPDRGRLRTWQGKWCNNCPRSSLIWGLIAPRTTLFHLLRSLNLWSNDNSVHVVLGLHWPLDPGPAPWIICALDDLLAISTLPQFMPEIRKLPLFDQSELPSTPAVSSIHSCFFLAVSDTQRICHSHFISNALISASSSFIMVQRSQQNIAKSCMLPSTYKRKETWLKFAWICCWLRRVAECLKSSVASDPMTKASLMVGIAGSSQSVVFIMTEQVHPLSTCSSGECSNWRRQQNKDGGRKQTRDADGETAIKIVIAT